MTLGLLGRRSDSISSSMDRGWVAQLDLVGPTMFWFATVVSWRPPALSGASSPEPLDTDGNRGDEASPPTRVVVLRRALFLSCRKCSPSVRRRPGRPPLAAAWKAGRICPPGVAARNRRGLPAARRARAEDCRRGFHGTSALLQKHFSNPAAAAVLLIQAALLCAARLALAPTLFVPGGRGDLLLPLTPALLCPLLILRQRSARSVTTRESGPSRSWGDGRLLLAQSHGPVRRFVRPSSPVCSRQRDGWGPSTGSPQTSRNKEAVTRLTLVTISIEGSSGSPRAGVNLSARGTPSAANATGFPASSRAVERARRVVWAAGRQRVADWIPWTGRAVRHEDRSVVRASRDPDARRRPLTLGSPPFS